MLTRRHLLLAAPLAAAGSGFTAVSAANAPASFSAERVDECYLLRTGDARSIVRYVAGELPEGERKASIRSGGFCHPLHTPLGEIVTDLAPADHPHHRGIFCGWVHVEGEKAGDWWGWGAKAPTEGRLIVNREARVTEETEKRVVMRVINSWRAEDETVLGERVTVTASTAAGCNVVDYELKYAIPTRKTVLLAQNPFGGFCYRARPRGKAEVSGPGGVIGAPDSVFDRQQTNWPPSRWYDLTYRDGEKSSGVAIIDHPDNPPSTWHVHRGIPMLNPCIVADAPVNIVFGEPLYLKYRVIAHDGDAAAIDFDTLYETFSKTRS